MTTTQATRAEVQRAVVERIWYDGLNKGDMSFADECLTPDFQNHGGHDDSVRGPAAMRLLVGTMHGAFSDLKYEILDFIPQADKAAVRWVLRGTHIGEFFGVPATGKKVEYEAIIILRFEGDKIAERWGVVDLFGLMRQLNTSP
jgi:steroid delta-isomerase-like uncharacterized protein